MKNITFRAATREDAPSLLHLFAQLGYPCDQSALEKRFETFVAHKSYGVVVACRVDQIIGWVAWSVTPFFVSDKTRIHVEGLVVDERYRGQGIGKKLMVFVEDVATTYSPAVIDLTSGRRRATDGSHSFYKSLGYRNEGPMEKVYLRKEV
jgi:GNAT superfamily N-acetyltransferase